MYNHILIVKCQIASIRGLIVARLMSMRIYPKNFFVI